jgi:SAM-dependent methyltransferase
LDVEYTNPEQYDAENVWAADDDFYLALAQEVGGPILDVGCGTGRLTRAIAAAGQAVTGLDLSPYMLSHARSLSDGLDVEWIEGDARTMQLGRRFRLILMTGHVFQHFLSDQDQRDVLDRAQEHLLEDGYLAFETRNYSAKTFGQSAEPTLWRSFQDPQGRMIDTYVGGRYDPDNGVEQLVFEDVNRATGERERSTSALRYVSVEQLNSMLREHGFSVVHQYGDWAKGPLGDDQPEIISICQLSADASDLSAG